MLSAAHDASGKDVHVPTNNKKHHYEPFHSGSDEHSCKQTFLWLVFIFLMNFLICDYRMLHLGYSVCLGMMIIYCNLWFAWELAFPWVTWLVVIKDSSCCSCQFWGSQIWDSALTTCWEQMASWRGLWAGDLQCQWWTWLIAGSSREAIGHS